MKVVVNDANILIDIVKLEITHKFFQLNLEFYTTDMIFYEELNEDQINVLREFVEMGSLQISALTEDEMVALQEKSGTISNLSDYDLSAYEQAVKLDAILVTSDNNLRKYAKENGREVHGHLWVLDSLVDNEVLSGLEATSILKRLCTDVNPRLGLPKKECDKRYESWVDIG